MELTPVDLPDVGVTIPQAPFQVIILDCSTWSFIDSMGVKALTSVSTVVKSYITADWLP